MDATLFKLGSGLIYISQQRYVSMTVVHLTYVDHCNQPINIKGEGIALNELGNAVIPSKVTRQQSIKSGTKS